jgi:4'-phosphopantetheinyl transferase
MKDDDDLPATLNRQAVSDVLSGRAFPRLRQAEALGMFLAKLVGKDPEVVRQSLGGLWKQADLERRSPFKEQAAAGDSGRKGDSVPQPGSLLHALYNLEDELFPHEIESDVALMVSGPTDSRWDSVTDVLSRAGSVLIVGRLTHWQPGPDEPISLLLGPELGRYEREKDPAERRRLLRTRLLIRHAVAAATGCNPHEVQLTHRIGGSPYIRGLDRIDISLTVEGDLAVVGLSEVGLIGVGIATAESVADRPSGELLDILAPHEVDFLRSIPREERMSRLMNLWVLKDAYTKAIGQGRQFSYTEFEFTVDQPDAPSLSFERSTPESRWSFAIYSTSQGHRIGTAVHNAGYDDESFPIGEDFMAKMRQFVTSDYFRK